jgi:hypothetical protein
MVVVQRNRATPSGGRVHELGAFWLSLWALSTQIAIRAALDLSLEEGSGERDGPECPRRTGSQRLALR